MRVGINEKQTICAILQNIMPLKTPFSSSKKKAGAKGKGKSSKPAPGKNKEKAAPKKGKAATPPPPPPEPALSLTFWDTLSDERKLDVVGAVMSVIGILMLLIIFSAQRSAPLEKLVSILNRSFGWGIYVLPIGLIVMGLWLIFRRIEKLPPLTLERGTGIIVFFLWLLAAMHAFVAAPEMAEQAAMDGAGGGYLGSVFE